MRLIYSLFFEFFLIFLAGSAVVTASEASAVDSDDLCRRANNLLGEVEAARGISIGRVDCLILSKEKYVELANSLIALHNSESELTNQEMIFKVLGFIDMDYNYSGCFLKGSGAASSAFYDHNSHKLVLRNDEYTPDATLAHELVHALQDKLYNLKGISELSSYSTDNVYASAALVEGDAVNIEKDFQKDTENVSQAEARIKDDGYEPGCTPNEPLYSLFLFPYEWGKIYTEGLSFEQRDALFKSPPQSTKQVLHKKNKGIPNPPAWKNNLIQYKNQNTLYADSLGEFIIRNLLKKYISRDNAILAGKGWKSDVIQLSQDTVAKGLYYLNWKIELNSDAAAVLLHKAFKDYLSKRFMIKIDQNAGNVNFELEEFEKFSKLEAGFFLEGAIISLKIKLFKS